MRARVAAIWNFIFIKRIIGRKREVTTTSGSRYIEIHLNKLSGGKGAKSE